MLHVARLAGAKSYDVQMVQGDSTIEKNWKPVTTSATSPHILIEGLTLGQTYWFRIRSSGGEGVWTDPVSVIVT